MSVDGLSVALILLAILVAAVAQSMTGVGFGLIAGPALLLLAPDLMPGSLLVASLVVLTVTLRQNRAGFHAATVLLPGVLSLPGAALGSLLLLTADPAVIRLIIGAVVVVAVLTTVAGVRLRQNRVTLAVAGFAAGSLASIGSIPAPPMLLVYRPETVEQLRANLSALFLFTTVAGLTTGSVAGVVGPSDVWPGLALGCVAGLGQVLSMRLSMLVPVGPARIAALALCLVGGVTLVVTSLTGEGL